MNDRTVILYHGGCPDGFGGAYAAWKKFGDAAQYLPVRHQTPPPEGLEGADVYLVDFSYPKPILDELESKVAKLTILDHHEGAREAVESVKHHVYDANRSGAGIAWSFFHPDTEVPLFLQYVQDGDLYRFNLPDSRAVLAYCYSKPFGFEAWDELCTRLENPEALAEVVRFGTLFKEHGDALIRELVERAKLVRFEGYEVYFTSTISAFSSDLANVLARKKGPLALAVQARPDGLRVSLRGDGTVNVAELAQKYGGNGHPNASAFSLKWGDPIPWEVIDENPVD